MPDADLCIATRNRLHWQCRRGMRELDELLMAFMEQRYDGLDRPARQQFELLLAYPDGVLLELLMGRMRPADPHVTTLVDAIRHTAQA